MVCMLGVQSVMTRKLRMMREECERLAGEANTSRPLLEGPEAVDAYVEKPSMSVQPQTKNERTMLNEYRAMVAERDELAQQLARAISRASLASSIVSQAEEAQERLKEVSSHVILMLESVRLKFCLRLCTLDSDHIRVYRTRGAIVLVRNTDCNEKRIFSELRSCKHNCLSRQVLWYTGVVQSVPSYPAESHPTVLAQVST